MEYYSQANQDKWVCHILSNKKNGYFLDFGAHEGTRHSNTYSLEKYLDWNGLCVEADTNLYNKLKSNRKCLCINCAITNYDGTCFFSNEKIQSQGTQIQCLCLNSILERNKCPHDIDYMSIDIEGNEFKSLAAFNFSKWNIKLITLEHNLYLNGPEEKNKLFDLMSNNGYTRVIDNALCLENHPSVYKKPFEDWYIKNTYMKAFEETINSWR